MASSEGSDAEAQQLSSDQPVPPPKAAFQFQLRGSATQGLPPASFASEGEEVEERASEGIAEADFAPPPVGSGASSCSGPEAEETAADLRARLARAEASLRMTEASRDELARQQGQYRGLIAKVRTLRAVQGRCAFF